MEKTFITLVIAAAIALGLSGCCREPLPEGTCNANFINGGNTINAVAWCKSDKNPVGSRRDCLDRFEAFTCTTDTECQVFFGGEY